MKVESYASIEFRFVVTEEVGADLMPHALDFEQKVRVDRFTFFMSSHLLQLFAYLYRRSGRSIQFNHNIDPSTD